MDYKTARNFLINQGTALETQRNPDDFLMRLSQEKSPVPGQQTSILLALKMVFDALKDETNLDKELVNALHLLSFESRRLYEKGLRAGVEWPFLLNEDLNRIDLAVRSIFSGTWQS
ncbi:Dethiobiotin synthetase [Floridanema aerugineum]|uniref:Dethiobiotin synthetase n=1 Tax=Floridaenema aerugineum BLCC-F46 TaxID=3153654 RepID=A0ABV4X3V1_9CYAN